MPIKRKTTAPISSLFHPRSIAVIGASRDAQLLPLKTLLSGGYKGKIFPVNPHEKKMCGLRVYRSAIEVPEPVDYAMILTPAAAVPEVLKDCADKKIPFAQILASGFSEMGEKGRRREEELKKIAKNTRILGPNCLGVYCPESGLTFRPDFPRESGSVSFVSQSGGMAVAFVLWTQSLGVRFSKVVNYGNGCDLNEADFIEYLAGDRKSKIISVYVEGIKSGRRFLDVCADAARKKPLIVWKAGKTREGTRAAKYHTGTYVTLKNLGASLKRSSAVVVHNLPEMVYTTLAFSLLPLPKGRRTCVVGMSGGASVTNADACMGAGLLLPKPSQRTIERVKEVIEPAGTSLVNPIDLAVDYLDADVQKVAIENLGVDPNFDSLIIEAPLHVALSEKDKRETEQAYKVFGAMLQSCKKVRRAKPLVIVLPHFGFEEMRRKIKKTCIDGGFAVFDDVPTAARALANMVEYGSYQR